METYKVNLVMDNMTLEQFKELQDLINNLEFNECIVSTFTVKEDTKL